ncbi:hypothetical protein [Embleya sp. AB8]|uniref:hypothetical protein n=1 Tax=Embleya sp. AB8 TaxID=3156304 RepID=UPI003C78F28C
MELHRAGAEAGNHDPTHVIPGEVPARTLSVKPPWGRVALSYVSVRLETKEFHLDAGWYRTGLRVVLLAPGWGNVDRSHASAGLDGFGSTLEAWPGMVTKYGRLLRPAVG